MILASLVLFAVFDLSPTPGAVHRCEAWLRVMVPTLCADPVFPAELVPCMVMTAPMPVLCAVSGNGASAQIQPAPGQVLGFCIFADNSAGRSGCAEPVSHN